MAKRIKITQPGWEGFTGEFGMMTFTDGVSDDLVGARQFNIMAAALAIVEVDEDGETLGSPGIQDNMKGASLLVAPVLTPLTLASDEELKTEAKTDAQKAKSGPAPDPTEIVFHTQAELEAIAEKKGVKGLREIGDPLNVKGRSINELVKEILKAEAKLKSHAEALAASSETTREPEPAPAEDGDVVAEGDAPEAPTEQPEGEPAADAEKPEQGTDSEQGAE